METSEFPELFPRRGPELESLNTVLSYGRTREMLRKVEAQIELLTEQVNAPNAKHFRNPRQEAAFLHNSKTLAVLMQQQNRLKDKLVELETRIREDMSAEK